METVRRLAFTKQENGNVHLQDLDAGIIASFNGGQNLIKDTVNPNRFFISSSADKSNRGIAVDFDEIEGADCYPEIQVQNIDMLLEFLSLYFFFLDDGSLSFNQSTYDLNGFTNQDSNYFLRLGDINGNGLIQVTYAELVGLINTSDLVTGQKYLLTDYQTVYKQPLTNITKSSGIIEPLILTAVSINHISNLAQSTLYPKDIVYYEVTGNLNNGLGTEGFTKGKIYRRIDTLKNNDIGTDWRHIQYVVNGIEGLLFKNYASCGSNTISYYGMMHSVIGAYFSGNKIKGPFITNIIADLCYDNTVDGAFYQNTIEGIFHSNKTGDFIGNRITGVFINNTVGNFFASNKISNFTKNIVGINFQNAINSNVFLESHGTIFCNNLGNVNDSFVGTPEIADENYQITVFKSPNGTIKQRYYNDLDVLVINDLIVI